MPDPTDLLRDARSTLAGRILQRTGPGQLLRPPDMPGLMLIRQDQALLDNCAVYEPCVALIVQGSKRVLLGDETLHYGEDRYLIASMDLPVRTAVL